MKKISYTLEIGFAGCHDFGETEVPDSTTNREIDELIHDMAIEWANTWEGDTRLYDEWDEETTEQYYEGVYGSWEFIE